MLALFHQKKCSRFQNFLLNRFLCLEIKSFDIFLERDIYVGVYQVDLKIYTYIPKYSKCEHTLYFIISDQNRKKLMPTLKKLFCLYTTIGGVLLVCNRMYKLVLTLGESMGAFSFYNRSRCD